MGVSLNVQAVLYLISAGFFNADGTLLIQQFLQRNFIFPAGLVLRKASCRPGKNAFHTLLYIRFRDQAQNIYVLPLKIHHPLFQLKMCRFPGIDR